MLACPLSIYTERELSVFLSFACFSLFPAAVVLGTSFLFLTLIDFSFINHIYSAMQIASASNPGVAITAEHPLAQALGQYLAWRTTGAPLLKYWEMLIACLVPLALLGMVKEVIDSARGLKAPLLRHLLDVESLVQLVSVVAIVAAQAAPAQAKFVALTMGHSGALAVDETGSAVPQASSAAAAAAGGGGDIVHQVRQLTNAHFLIFALNAVQFFVPFWRLRIQARQAGLMAAEVAAIEKANVAAALARKNAEIIAAALAAQAAAPPGVRAEAAERAFAGDAAAPSDLRRRK